MLTRRIFLSGASAVLATSASLTACSRNASENSIDFDAKARKLIASYPSFDLHAHPGRTFLRDAQDLSPGIAAFAAGGAFEEEVIASMAAGGMTAAVFCAVADIEVLDFRGDGLGAARAFAPGEAFASYWRQINKLNELFSAGLAVKALSPVDILAAQKSGQVAAVLGVEGGDFLEGSAERVAEAFEDGVRCINPVHYTPNELGDIMTDSAVHGGLTQAGRGVVRAMNAAGIIIDLAHAAEKTAFGILETTTKPVICSHTHIRSETIDGTRFISLELAKEIANAGGVIGAWPAGIGIDSLNGFVDRIIELVDAVGIDHVGLGTDMDANYKPVWKDYREFPDVVARLLERGLDEAGIAKIIGGNGLRVFGAVAA